MTGVAQRYSETGHPTCFRRKKIGLARERRLGIAEYRVKMLSFSVPQGHARKALQRRSKLDEFKDNSEGWQTLIGATRPTFSLQYVACHTRYRPCPVTSRIKPLASIQTRLR